jgi:hypothetical protein
MMRTGATRLFLLAALCLVAYAPTLTIPLIGDDYSNLSQSLTLGTMHGAHQLWSDSTFRLRATSYWTMYALWSTARLSAAAYHVVGLMLHFAATLLVYRLALAWEPMRGGALWAAAFFAIYEGHQEAVMWFSAINELFLFVFGVGALLCWLRAAKSRWWHVPGLILFALALLSKESALILLPLFILVRWRIDWTLTPYIALAILAATSILESHATSFRFSDGSFSLSAPFWITLPHSAFRLLWIWGILALIVWIVRKQSMRPVWLAFLWIGLALAPYSFLTYSTAIPSRQIYLASAGLAMLVGLAFYQLTQWADRRTIWCVAAVILIVNAGILWTKKRSQFLERAAPTEQLFATLRTTSGPVSMSCFPSTKLIAEESVRLAMPEALPRMVWGGACAKPNAGAR